MTFLLKTSLAGALLFLAAACGSEEAEPTEVSATSGEDASEVSAPPLSDEARFLGAMAGGLVGSWVSDDDAKAQLEYRQDGTVTNSYDGEDMGGGTWSLSHEKDADLFVLTQIMDGETYSYTVLTVTDDVLQLSYRPRGNTLSYKRVR